MALEELEKLSRKQIRTKINECFQQAESRGVEERSGHLAEAEFFMLSWNTDEIHRFPSATSY